MGLWSEGKIRNIINCIYEMGVRNEKETSEYSLSSFYDYNLTQYLLNSKNHQVIQGSRGTGKTHILRVLKAKMEVEQNCCIYLDCRSIGSNGSCGFDDNPNPTRFFQHFLESLHEELLRYYSIERFDTEEIKQKALYLLKELKAAAIVNDEVINKVTHSVSDNTANKADGKTGMQVKWPFSGEVSLERNNSHNKSRLEETTQDISVRTSISFSRFGSLLRDLLFLTERKLIVLLDEWSSIPLGIQPYFAEFLRRTLFPINEVRFKIAVVPQRKCFRDESNGYPIGLELGADLMVALDLDKRYSVDSSPKDIIKFCFHFFCKHLSSSMNEKIDPKDFVANMFPHEDDAFVLVRASEGNPRDFIHLTFLCLQGLQRELSLSSKITKDNIVKASKDYFETTKYSNCDAVSRGLLEKLIQFVVGSNKNRGFLVDRKYLDQHPWKNLIDNRVLHVLENAYYDSFSASRSCALIIINFGAYSDILLTGKTVNFFCSGDFLETKVFGKLQEKHGVALPYTDGRMFNRCFLDDKNNLHFTQYFNNR